MFHFLDVHLTKSKIKWESFNDSPFRRLVMIFGNRSKIARSQISKKKKTLIKEKFQFFPKSPFNDLTLHQIFIILTKIYHRASMCKWKTTHLLFGVPQKNRIVLLEPQYGKFTCALMCSLRGQNGGQIWNQREILYKISFYQLSTPPSGIP